MNGTRGSSDPTVIRSIAVTTDDLVTALEANWRGTKSVVLRVTPPFYGRMRARIHLTGGESADYDEPSPLHLTPGLFVSESTPSYPEADETRPEPYEIDEHHERHTAAVREWRTAVREHLRETVELPATDEPHEIEVKYLG
ncbi:hypothetical protein C440_00255 [Haloferax mucosum ATCC BAA-1512]|uniref:DUF8009 domain-containing protein n=1 Tax=Haloferax mucosum ATCC BAA-1512 TaxID=662479 RepID=M0IPI7_9EURY|nr:hypothetical protein [Haloferax mucosum]ELZ98741.1 hypothetical protein C440_00255 [Haloferax mucosum ATCC BAA-1512]